MFQQKLSSIYRKNESSICSSELNCMHPIHAGLFLKVGLLGTMGGNTRVYCILHVKANVIAVSLCQALNINAHVSCH
jgi:hypothetical protein